MSLKADPSLSDRRILIATDGSPAAHAAVEAGLDLALAMHARVTFFHAVSPLAEQLFSEYPMDGPPTEAVLARDGVLRDAVGLAAARGVDASIEVKASAHVGAGDLAAEIAGIASGIGAMMIVVGSRGFGAVAGTVLGSVSHNLIKWATVPVLVVHAPLVDSHPE